MRNAVKWLAAPALLLGFLAAVVSIVLTPLESGDAYPPYSTLRADPMGAKILYDSLLDLPDLRVERNFQTLSRLRESEPGTLFFLGGGGPAFAGESEAQLKEWESLTAAGWRLVFVFQNAMPALEANFDVFKNEKKKESQKVPPVRERWGLHVKLRTATVKERAELDRTPRSSALYFESDGSWRVVSREEDGRASHVEKAMGKGSVALLSGIYGISNEGLSERPNGALVSGLVAGNRRIVFDELHNGVAETGSVGSLIRRYRMEGAVALLLLAGILFVWRNATSLFPMRPSDGPAGPVSGRNTQQGLLTLLRRSVPSDRLIDVCLAEWEKSSALRPALSADRATRARQRPADPETPAEAYRRIHQVLTERK
jgi:hypothetical protein